MTSLKRFTENLPAVLNADADIQSWLNTHFGAGTQLTVIEGNVPVTKILPAELPAIVIEVGEGEDVAEDAVLGGAGRVHSQTLEIGIVWAEQDNATAFQQRRELPPILATAIMRNSGLDTGDGNGDAVDGAWLASWDTDRGDRALHPTHFMAAQVMGEYEVRA